MSYSTSASAPGSYVNSFFAGPFLRTPDRALIVRPHREEAAPKVFADSTLLRKILGYLITTEPLTHLESEAQSYKGSKPDVLKLLHQIDQYLRRGTFSPLVKKIEEDAAFFSLINQTTKTAVRKTLYDLAHQHERLESLGMAQWVRLRADLIAEKKAAAAEREKLKAVENLLLMGVGLPALFLMSRSGNFDENLYQTIERMLPALGIASFFMVCHSIDSWTKNRSTPESDVKLFPIHHVADYLSDRTHNLSNVEHAALFASAFASLCILLGPTGATAVGISALFHPIGLPSWSAHHDSTVPDRFLKNSTEASFSTALAVREESPARTQRAAETGLGLGL